MAERHLLRISAAEAREHQALLGGAAIVDRGGRGRLRLSGKDRRAYLQGLLTNDIAALGPGTGCYAAYLTAQGRMIADMRVFELGDAVLIDLEGPVAATVRDRLAQFVFSEDVAIEDLTDETTQIGVYGPDAPRVVAAAFAAEHAGGEPSPAAAALEAMDMHANARWDFRGAPVHVLRGDDPGVAGFDLVAGAALRDALHASLRAAGAGDVSDPVVETVRIEAGRPRFGADMDEETIPLEAGIEDRAISRTKGCYVGQEIIIRVIDRGHGRVARRLVGLRLASPRVPARGEVIRGGDREIGRVTSAAFSPRLDAPIALGYVHRDFVEPGTQVTIGADAATVAATPFAAP
jgi:folate-binding protein YgfZ